MAMLPLLILMILVLVPVVGQLIHRGRARRAVRPITRPSCPRCRYDLEHLSGPRCPECGADLEAGGVIDRRDPRRGALLGLRILVLVPLSLVMVMLTATLLGRARPRIWTWTTQATLRDLAPDVQASSGRIVVERRRTERTLSEPDRKAFGPGRIRVIVPGATDRVLLDRPESEVADLADESVAAELSAGLREIDAAGPVDVATAIVRDLVDERFTPDPTRRFGTMDAVRAAVARSTSVRILGTRDDVVWRKPIATWPRTVGFLVGGGLLVIGVGLSVREYRRGRPVPWSVAGVAATSPPPPTGAESVSCDQPPPRRPG